MHVTAPQTLCRLGIRRVDITPPAGIYHRMWGAATHDRAEGVHRPLTSTAVVLTSHDDAQRVGLVALDHCLLFPDEMRALRARLREAASLADDALVVTFSHTHGAGLMDTARAELPGGELIAPYLDELAERTADALREAAAACAPATIVYGAGRCALAAHRDFWDAERGQWVCGFTPEVPADDTVVVARATGSDGRPLCTFVNYACHPTTLAFANRLVSPDYPGAMRELVETATECPCVFLQGASGELGPREGFVGDPAVADRNGRQLGHAALAALEGLPPPETRFAYRGPVVSGATLGIWEHEPLDAGERETSAAWQLRGVTIPLLYREGLPGVEATRVELERWTAAEAEATRASQADRARDARAMAERMRRQLARLEKLPAGERYPYRASLWKAGGAAWIAVPGEPYSLLQRRLRERFPETPIVVIELADGWGPSYLPERDTYGKGIYQEEIAVVAPGSLERVADTLLAEIESMTTPA